MKRKTLIVPNGTLDFNHNCGINGYFNLKRLSIYEKESYIG